MTTIPEQLEEGVYTWVFGDGDEDPGVLVSEGKHVPDFLVWLGELERQVALLKRTLGAKVSESEALARLRALKDEIERAQPIEFPAAIEDIAQRVVPLDEIRRRRQRRLITGGAIVLAIAAAFLLITRLQDETPEHRDVSAATARHLTHDIAGDGGFGFGGGIEPTAHDRGFLIGAIIDLSRQRSNGSPPGSDELDLARSLATRALVGLDAPDDEEGRRMRALGGCAAILGDDPERADCERGMMSYATARDNVLH